MWTSLIRRIRSFVVLRRRALAAVATGLCVLALVSALSPPPPATVAVVAVTTSVPAGSALTTNSLGVVQLPPEAVPSDAVLDRSEIIGRSAAINLTARMPVTRSLLAAPAPPAGMRHVPVRTTDSDLVSILSVGDKVSVYGIGPDGTMQALARSVRVVRIMAPGGDRPLGGDSSGSMLVLEVSEALAGAVAGATLQRSTAIVLG